MNRIQQAQEFAHKAHDSIKQVRKYTGEPYWVHTDEVANIVDDILSDTNQAASLTKSRGAIIHSPREIDNMISAAHLHDVIEDVFPYDENYSIFVIDDMFGREVASLVMDLTDVYVKETYPKMNRADRKQKERERLGKVSVAAKTIKLADLISNTRSIVEHDKDFAMVYIREKLALLPYLSEGNSILLGLCSEMVIKASAELGIDIPMLGAKII